MATSIDTTGLKNFITKIRNVKSPYIITMRAKAIAQEEFETAFESDPDMTDIKIQVKVVKGEKVEVFAKDTKSEVDIGYFEFGTGVEGRGTYQGKLPTGAITFNTRLGSKTTMGWEYYYQPSPAKRTRFGMQGWYLPKSKGGYFVTGQGAHNTFYYACKRIRERLIKEAFR